MNTYTPLTQEQINILKTSICAECTDQDLKLFIMTCDRVQLDPFARHIYPSFRNTKQKDNTYKKIMHIQMTIDGLRIIALRSGIYQGQTVPLWCDQEGKWYDVWLKDSYPFACKIGVHVKDYKEPVYAVAKWDTYVQVTKEGKVTGMWNKMPDLMLAKCAEALALRKALPNDLSGLYTSDEMGQANNENESDNVKTTKVIIPGLNENKISIQVPKQGIIPVDNDLKPITKSGFSNQPTQSTVKIPLPNKAPQTQKQTEDWVKRYEKPRTQK